MKKGETSKVGTTVDREDQGGRINGRTRNGAAELGRRPGQLGVPVELRDDLSAHIFWKWGS